ncbi:hypothetical protein ASPACDRAFT_39122 [Aspergillus aculeatus ATCC 16872]|uniref:DUF7582 domain-containing protein n=1 Tax=Aspergillus aculeatus (strain ATCC 16872 / CBS 172.66 / WB 5094) TaxID=690307 RepID=A0A1L9X4W3_ASPA1|nr:uncharacterized protein ASPACDRAFT_39122 [Aspergillus aculeatus ATCC 16872]OJK03506.1 hypothetical protein ASPACDRAFT_39122 [Aspergillus aculeatus ATCC 16872]
MVGVRLPRPAGVYVPARSLSPDMISSPLSPSFNFDSETLTPSIIPALEYISAKLEQKMMHVTLLVGRGKPYPTGEPSDLIIIPITPLDEMTWPIVYRMVAKAAIKFSLGQSWIDALNRSLYESAANDYLKQQSIMQNEVIFSREGLTLLNVDRIYTFKRRLCILSNRGVAPEESYITSCTQLLHRTIQDFHGRPFSKAFFHRVYEQLNVSDELLTHVANAYKKQYNDDGIILPPQPKAESPRKVEQLRKGEQPRKSPRSTRAIRRQGPPPTRYVIPTKRGPKTPLSASDVTPITQNEWNMVIGPDFPHHTKATVTKWTPSPTVMAAA